MSTRRFCLLQMVLLTLSGCGGSKPDPAASTTSNQRNRDQQQREAGATNAKIKQAQLDSQVDNTLRALTRAAKRSDRTAAARLAQELDQLSRQADAASPLQRMPRDPYAAMQARFQFKRSPLFVKQISKIENSHQLFVGIDPAIFCLNSRATRLDAARTVYRAADRYLRKHRVNDFEFVVVPAISTLPSRRDALAIGSHGTLQLTSRGQNC